MSLFRKTSGQLTDSVNNTEILYISVFSGSYVFRRIITV